MKQIVILSSFERSLRRLTPEQKKQVAESLEVFNQFLVSGYMPSGLGFKKINHDKFEFRVDIRIRVILKVEGNEYYLVLVGNHDDVRRYLKKFR